MNIFVNGQIHSIEDNITLQGLLESMELAGRRVAVEVNLDIVPRSQHANHTLHDGDRVEVVHAIGGG